MRRFYTIPEVAEAFATSEAQFEAATFAAKALELA